MAAPNRTSRLRMLDAAERLFAEKGYDSTTTREIAALSGGTLGTFSHHFRSKNDLLVEVVRRRFADLGQLRRDRYQALVESARGAEPGVEDVIDCIITPFLERAMCGGPEWRSYVTLLIRLIYVGHGSNPDVEVFTDEVGKEFLGWIARAAPGAPADDVAYAYQFTIALMVDSAAQWQHDRLSRLTNGGCSNFEFEAVRARLLRYSQAGSRALLGLS